MTRRPGWLLIGIKIAHAVVCFDGCRVPKGVRSDTNLRFCGDARGASYDPLVDARKHPGLWRASAICNALCGVVASVPVTLRILARPFQRSLPSVRRMLARHFPNSRANVWTVYCLYCIGKVDRASPLRRRHKQKQARFRGWKRGRESCLSFR
jgi:hypothetical protein